MRRYLTVDGVLKPCRPRCLKVVGTESAEDEVDGQSLLDEITREGARLALVWVERRAPAAYLAGETRMEIEDRQQIEDLKDNARLSVARNMPRGQVARMELEGPAY